MATSFNHRIGEGERFEGEVERFLQRHAEIIAVSRTGAERTHPQFAALLRNRDDPASKFFRFAPDGVAIPSGDPLFYWDAKCSCCMERDAFEAYCKLEQLECHVLVFIRTQQAVFTSWASTIPFISSEQVVSRYPEDRRFPIEAGWICPRRATNRGDLIFGSGTPYREIDIEQCNHLMDIKSWNQTTEEV